jgi:hypothetical protein
MPAPMMIQVMMTRHQEEGSSKHCYQQQVFTI